MDRRKRPGESNMARRYCLIIFEYWSEQDHEHKLETHLEVEFDAPRSAKLSDIQDTAQRAVAELAERAEN